jgi:glycerate 2-kinase
MTILLSPNAMKGSLSAFESASIMQTAIETAAPEIDSFAAPIADGGNGTLDCLAMALNADYRTSIVRGPIGRMQFPAEWGYLGHQHLAIIETAQSTGLHLLAPDQRDALHASTYGVGELIKAALDAGCTSIIIGLGGSATNDGGAGCMRALGVRFLDTGGGELPDGGAALAHLETIDRSAIDPRIFGTRFIVLCDVTNPLCGPEGASHVFGPQKGATEDDVRVLDGALAQYASVLKREFGRDIASIPGSGAAGGLAAALLAFCQSEFVSGIEYILDAIGYDHLLQSCDAVLTSEGMIDTQTEHGKGVSGLCRRAAKFGKPVHAFVGRINGDARLIQERVGLASLVEISPRSIPLEEAIAHAPELLYESVAAFIASYRRK